MANSRAVENLIVKAREGNLLSMYRLAMRYYKGNGTEQNFENALGLAFALLKILAPNGFQNLRLKDEELHICIDSMILIAECFEKGCGVNKDLEKAFTWYRIASEIGNINALFMVKGNPGSSSIRARNALITLLKNDSSLQQDIYIPNSVEYEAVHGSVATHIELEQYSGYSFYIEEFKKNNLFRKEYSNGNIELKNPTPIRGYVIFVLFVAVLFGFAGLTSDKGDLWSSLLFGVGFGIVAVIFVKIFD